jgi:hypothetical protein
MELVRQELLGMLCLDSPNGPGMLDSNSENVEFSGGEFWPSQRHSPGFLAAQTRMVSVVVSNQLQLLRISSS